jgi:Na+-translocating ferredoxin:NAD+ oxidoreductase RnfD subunit
VSYLILGALSTVVFVLFQQSAPVVQSFLAGVVIFGTNLVLLSIGWSLILRKKLVALAISIIVIKYAILVASIYYLTQKSWVKPEYIILASGLMIPAAFVQIVRKDGI